MRNFVNCEEEVVIQSSTNNICANEEHEREGVCMSEPYSSNKLNGHNCKNYPFCKRLMSHEFRDLNIELIGILRKATLA
jgi:hypothetical protein